MRSEPFRALVLGGYGNFGARVSRALAADPSIQLIHTAGPFQGLDYSVVERSAAAVRFGIISTIERVTVK